MVEHQVHVNKRDITKSTSHHSDIFIKSKLMKHLNWIKWVKWNNKKL